MTVAASTAVWKHSRAKRGGFTVMLALADAADDHGFVVYRKHAEKTLAALAKKARLSRKALIDILPGLEELGELKIVRGGAGAGDVHEYRLILPGLETDEERARDASDKGEETTPLNEAARALDKGEETTPFEGLPAKGEVSAVKGEVSADKGEETTPFPIRNNQLPITTTPRLPSGDSPQRGSGLSITDLDLERAFSDFAALAAELSLPSPRTFDRDRRTRLRQRLAEHGREAWPKALSKIRGSPFLRGDNERGWKIDLDALLQAKTFRKLIEGSYDGKSRNARDANRLAIAGALAARRQGG